MVKSLGVLVFVVCCALQVAQLEAAECRAGFPTLVSCGAKNKDFNGCISRRILEIVRRFIGGNKALNLPSLDPLQVPYPKIVVEDGKGKVELQQCTLTGTKDTQLTNGQYNFPTRATYDLTIPKFTLVCKQYTMSDGFLNAKKNEGYFTLSMPNYKARFTLTGEAVTQCKEQYLHILTSDSTLPSASDFVAFFSGLGKNQLKKDSLQPLIAKALAKAQAQFTFDLLTTIYSFLEPLRIVFPNNTSDSVVSCLQPRPTQCPAGKN